MDLVGLQEKPTFVCSSKFCIFLHARLAQSLSVVLFLPPMYEPKGVPTSSRESESICWVHESTSFTITPLASANVDRAEYFALHAVIANQEWFNQSLAVFQSRMLFLVLFQSSLYRSGRDDADLRGCTVTEWSWCFSEVCSR